MSSCAVVNQTWIVDIGSNPIYATFGTIAQLVEQQTENLRVPGSIPGGTTKNKPMSHRWSIAPDL